MGRPADSRQFAWAVPSDVYSQPWEEGGVVYILQEEGTPAVTSLTSGARGQGCRAERRAQVVSSGLVGSECSIESAHQGEPFLAG